MREGSKSTLRRIAANRVRSLLTIAEIAVDAGDADGRGIDDAKLWSIANVDYGFDVKNILSIEPSLSDSRNHISTGQQARFPS